MLDSRIEKKYLDRRQLLKEVIQYEAEDARLDEIISRNATILKASRKGNLRRKATNLAQDYQDDELESNAVQQKNADLRQVNRYLGGIMGIAQNVVQDANQKFAAEHPPDA